jgi:hypothetical protein
MTAMVVFAVTMLNLVRSKAEAGGRAFRDAAAQYSTLKKIYTPQQPATTDVNRAEMAAPAKSR